MDLPEIIHRDIKPANILLNESSIGIVAKLADFGLAKFKGQYDPGNPLIENQTAVGTPLYMAPEIKLTYSDGISDYNSSVDIYSCGLIFLELVITRSE